MILCPVVLFFPQLSFVNYLLPLKLVWGFWLCVVATETKLEEKIIPLHAGIIFVWQILNTFAQICAQGPGCADWQGEVFRSSFLSQLDSTTLPKGGDSGGGGGCQVVV